MTKSGNYENQITIDPSARTSASLYQIAYSTALANEIAKRMKNNLPYQDTEAMQKIYNSLYKRLSEQRVSVSDAIDDICLEEACRFEGINLGKKTHWDFYHDIREAGFKRLSFVFGYKELACRIIRKFEFYKALTQINVDKNFSFLSFKFDDVEKYRKYIENISLLVLQKTEIFTKPDLFKDAMSDSASLKEVIKNFKPFDNKFKYNIEINEEEEKLSKIDILISNDKNEYKKIVSFKKMTSEHRFTPYFFKFNESSYKGLLFGSGLEDFVKFSETLKLEELKSIHDIFLKIFDNIENITDDFKKINNECQRLKFENTETIIKSL